MIESCRNPFRSRSRIHSEIVLYIVYKGQVRPVCSACWKKLGDSAQEWRSES